MGAAYFDYLIKKIFGQDSFNKKPKESKFKYKDKNTEIIPAKQVKKIKYPKLSYSGPGISGIVITAITGIIGITIFGSLYSALNTSAFSVGTQSMMGLVPMVLIAAVMIGIIGTLLRV